MGIFGVRIIGVMRKLSRSSSWKQEIRRDHQLKMFLRPRIIVTKVIICSDVKRDKENGESK